MVVGREHVDHRYRGVLCELRDDRVRPGADPDRVDEARQHESGVAHRLAAGDLHLALAQHHRVAAELVHADLEREPRARRGLVEDQRDAAPREGLGAEPIALQLERAVEEPVELVGGKLVAGEEVTGHPRIVVRAVTWNLYHGRSVPPGPNRPLLPEFVRVLDSVEWEVALLQEAPPRWAAKLAHELRAESAVALT